MKRSVKAVCLSLGLALLVACTGAAADTDKNSNPNRTLSPYFFVENGDPAVDHLPLKETRADVRIAGVIADVVVTQVYRNEGTRPLNLRYPHGSSPISSEGQGDHGLLGPLVCAAGDGSPHRLLPAAPNEPSSGGAA